jgi:hypothetical protein
MAYFICLPEPAIVRAFRIIANKRMVDRFITPENLLMRLTLIVVLYLPTSSWKHRSDG